jgi:hypothetical protein
LTHMNLPGLQQRSAMCGRGRQGGDSLAVVFRSRPVSFKPGQTIAGMAMRARSVESRRPFQDGPAWQVSVELQATASGALMRRIKILITDDTRAESEKGAWG